MVQPPTIHGSDFMLQSGIVEQTLPSEFQQIDRTRLEQSFLLPDGYPDYIRLILTSRVYDIVSDTPLRTATNLSNRLKCNVMLKREDMHPTFSSELRGAYNKLIHLDPSYTWKGVVACNDGNHAEGVAYSARCLKIPTSIVIPLDTPEFKRNHLARLGVSVVCSGSNLNAAMKEAQRMQRQYDIAPIPAIDDPYIIAGQGTVGMEILKQILPQDLEAIFCAILNGTLIAGIGVYIKKIAPHIKVIGVGTFDSNPMVQSLMHDRQMKHGASDCTNGTQVCTGSGETYRLCREVIDEIELVTFDDTCAAIKDIYEDTRVVVEPDGALALAGLKKWVKETARQQCKRGVVAITFSGTLDFEDLCSIAGRTAFIKNQKEFHTQQ